MSAKPKPKYISPEEYLEVEDASLEKHEYFNGEIFQMAGASEKHNTISLNIAGELRQKLKKQDFILIPMWWLSAESPTSKNTKA